MTTLAAIGRTPSGPPRPARRTALETLHNLGAITDRQLWAGNRFRAGWEVCAGLAGRGRAAGFAEWTGSGGIALPAQERAVQAITTIARDYLVACEAMDALDVLGTDDHGAPRAPRA